MHLQCCRRLQNISTYHHLQSTVCPEKRTTYFQLAVREAYFPESVTKIQKKKSFKVQY